MALLQNWCTGDDEPCAEYDDREPRPRAPERQTQPWYASINGGRTAFRITGFDRANAEAVAACHVRAEVGEPTFDGPVTGILIYTPEEWTAHCERTRYTAYPARRAC